MNALAKYMDDNKLRDPAVAATLSISRTYVTQIRNGRPPSVAVALRIFRAFGLKMGPLVGASKAEIATLERVAERAA
jgi:hypothetical protein